MPVADRICERAARMLRDDRLSMPMSASRISPLRGSTWLGPIAPKVGDALVIQRIDARPKSSVSKSAFSGWTSTRIAFLKPIFSNALFHSRTPAVIAARYLNGTVRSIQKTIGLTGSESAASGSFFSRRQRLTKRWRGVRCRSLLKSKRPLSK